MMLSGDSSSQIAAITCINLYFFKKMVQQEKKSVVVKLADEKKIQFYSRSLIQCNEKFMEDGSFFSLSLFFFLLKKW